MAQTKKLCRSCSGPLEEFPKEDIIHPDFCPYCVDNQGNLKSYGDILEGMIEYIKSDHPEIDAGKQEKTAKEWLQEGPVWGEKWTGCIVEESLDDKAVLDLVDVKATEVEEYNDPKLNHGCPVWHVHRVEFLRTELEKVAEALSENLKPEGWWADVSGAEEVWVVFKGKIFKGRKDDETFREKVRNYALRTGVPESQLPSFN